MAMVLLDNPTTAVRERERERERKRERERERDDNQESTERPEGRRVAKKPRVAGSALSSREDICWGIE